DYFCQSYDISLNPVLF
nr:immunoglobulin light chain junction region [Macaca mulatta]MOX81663.1 immunoglobulin light chain junction region [Macaca mulatta]